MTGWRRHGGLFSGTAALEHLLAHAGVEPTEGLPAAESLLLGMGGIGFSVNLYPGPWGVYLAVGFTRATGSGVLQRDICRRLGILVEIEETGNAVQAGRALEERVRAGRPALLWGSQAALPYSGLRRELAPVTEHQWVVTGESREPVGLILADLAPGPLELSAEEVSDARAALFTAKHRRMTVVGAAPVESERQILGALAATLDSLREPLLPSQGLSGLERWAESLEDPGPRGWARQLAEGPALFDALTGLFRTAHLDTAGGLRRMWAEFLDLAARQVDEPALAEVADLYRSLAERWSGLAVAALPDEAPILAEARSLLTERDRLFRHQGWAKGGASEARLAELDRSLAKLRDRAGDDLLTSGSRAQELLTDLAGRVRRLHAQETRAARALAVAIDRRTG